MVMFKVSRVETKPYDGQKPGTSGLRRSHLILLHPVLFQVKMFIQPHYLQNFVQATFNALSVEKVRGKTLVVSGDGRYFSKEAIQASTLNFNLPLVGHSHTLFCPMVAHDLASRSILLKFLYFNMVFIRIKDKLVAELVALQYISSMPPSKPTSIYSSVKGGNSAKFYNPTLAVGRLSSNSIIKAKQKKPDC
ncbi:hypothetical protein Ancab_021195 [Ancistrocladus abbreviatus]